MVGAAGVSALWHIVLGLTLALYVTRAPSIKPSLVLISAPVALEGEVDEQGVSLVDITTFDDEQTSFSMLTDEAVASAVGDVMPASLEVESIQESLHDDVLAWDQTPLPLELDETVPPEGFLPVQRQAGGVVASKEVGAVIDRLTGEIAKHGAGRDVTVYWLLDASLSVSQQRSELANRLEKIVRQLHQDPDVSQVKHVIYSFGESCERISAVPSDDPVSLGNDVRAIKVDESGIENVFAAVATIIKGPAAKADGSTVIMIATDEVGDDRALVENVAELARVKTVPVYVIGSPAPFGQEKCEFKFVDPDPTFDQTERMAEVQQGPESLFKMTLNLSTLPIDRTAIDSGFGPYALTFLCHETGGLYFATHPNRRDAGRVAIAEISPMASAIREFFQPEVMRRYRPEYGNAGRLLRAVNTQPAKRALVKACGLPKLELTLPSGGRFPVASQDLLRRRFSDAQKEVATALFVVDQWYGVLNEDQARKSSESLKAEPRWDASYNLAIGRVLATKARLDCWNELLATAKDGLKATDPRTNVWLVEPSADLSKVNSKTKQYAEQATQCLEYVMESHSGTPWAAVASAELAVPFAYAWKEEYVAPPAPPKSKVPGPASNKPAVGNRSRPDDEPRRLAPKQVRAVKKI
jgi:hypothetical protein